MKIYDTTGIGALEIVEGEQKGVFLVDYNGDIDFHSVIEINGELYRPRSMSIKECTMSVEKLEVIDGSEVGDEEYGNVFTCPYCGDEYADAWELSEGSHETTCPNCSAELEYTKEYEVSYTVKLTAIPRLINVNE